jgi:hypothetical protein
MAAFFKRLIFWIAVSAVVTVEAGHLYLVELYGNVPLRIVVWGGLVGFLSFLGYVRWLTWRIASTPLSTTLPPHLRWF